MDNLWEFMLEKTWALMLEKLHVIQYLHRFHPLRVPTEFTKPLMAHLLASFERATVNALCSNALAQHMAQVCNN